MKALFDYLDYRQYLKDYYVEKKRLSRLSYREFAKMAGFSSPVFIKLVIDGKSNLGKSSVAKLAKAMQLKKEEKRFFKTMVLYNQAESVEQKIFYLERLKTPHSPVQPRHLSDEQFEYLSKWYHSVVRELINAIKFKGDCNELAELLSPPVRVADVKRSVQLLERLGLVESDGDGEYKATSQFLSTAGSSVNALAVRNVQRAMALLAGDAIDTEAPEVRDISGITMSMSSHGFARARDELARCRQRLLEISSQDKASNRIYRVNLHLFPMSRQIPQDKLKVNREVAREE